MSHKVELVPLKNVVSQLGIEIIVVVIRRE